MSSIQLIPKFGPGTAFAVANNSDWLDTMYFTQPGFGAPISVIGAITNGSPNLTVPDSSVLIPGMLVSSEAPGIPDGAMVGIILSSTQVEMLDSNGAPVNATLTDPGMPLMFTGPPLDLTGITFTATMRRAVGASQQYLALKSADGTLTSTDKNGTLSFNVPCVALVAGGTQMRGLPAGNYVLDIVATDGTNTINLFPQGPATVVVSQAVTIP